MRLFSRLSFALALAAALAAPASRADDAPKPEPKPQRVEGALERLLKRCAVPERERPAWADELGPARLRFAVLADVHLGRDDARLKRALAAVNRLKPAFAVFIGDNVNRAVVAEHARFRDLVDAQLECPWHVIKGDNDARAYVDVFGSTHWSFRCAGVHFIGTGLDIDAEGTGIGRLSPASWTWLEGRLKAFPKLPTVVFQHEPALPPTFLDAPRFAGLMGRNPQVRAVLHGHLHRDLELGGARGRQWWTLPAIGPNPRHGFKLLRVHGEALVAETWEDDGRGYRRARKWQRALWGAHAPAEGASTQVVGRQSGPAAPMVFDERLRGTWERLRRLLGR